MCNVYTVHITRLMSYITLDTRVQTFANIFSDEKVQQEGRRDEKISVAFKREGMLKKWTGGEVILIIWVLSDDPGLWDVLGNNIILYGVLHRLDSDEHQIRLLCSPLGPLNMASDVIWCLMSGHGSSYKCYNHLIRVWSILMTWQITMMGVSHVTMSHDGPGGMLKWKNVSSSPSMTLSEAAWTRRWKDCHLSLLTI